MNSNKRSLFSLVWLLPLVAIPLVMLFYVRSDGQGRQLYEHNCANCHMSNGKGLRSVIPALAGADYLTKFPQKLPCIIRNGLEGEILVNGQSYNQVMPANPNLSEADIANIINYIRNEWGNKHEFMPAVEVKKLLKRCD